LTIHTPRLYIAIMMMTPITLRIEDLRKAQGWSQSELARRSGVPQPTISRIESGKTSAVDFTVLEKLSNALGCDPGYLIVKKD